MSSTHVAVQRRQVPVALLLVDGEADERPDRVEDADGRQRQAVAVGPLNLNRHLVVHERLVKYQTARVQVDGHRVLLTGCGRHWNIR